jgi:membrane fusion protein (multidrug efflux system)
MQKIFNNRLQLFIHYSIVTVFLMLLYSCTSSSGNEAMHQQVQSLPVLTVQMLPATTYQEFSASLEGAKDIEIRPQVEGYLDRIYKDEGSYVRKGQSLFQINDRTYRAQLNNAKANLAAAKANLVNAQISINKLTPLVQNNIVSDVQLQTAKATYNASAAQVEQAEALVRNAEINLGYTLIKAPVSGYIGRIPLKIGSLVSSNTDEALTVLSEVKDVYAYFSLSENDFLIFKEQFPGNSIEEKVKKMPPVELVLSDNSIYPEKGKVQTVLGQFNNSTGAISFRAIFPNANNLLRSGNTGKIRIPQTNKAALVVPQESTFEVQDKVFVYVVGDSNKVMSKPLVIKGKTASYYFIEGGLQPGEKIVFAGTGNLRDGMPIVPQPISVDSLLKAKPL